MKYCPGREAEPLKAVDSQEPCFKSGGALPAKLRREQIFKFVV